MLYVTWVPALGEASRRAPPPAAAPAAHAHPSAQVEPTVGFEGEVGAGSGRSKARGECSKSRAGGARLCARFGQAQAYVPACPSDYSSIRLGLLLGPRLRDAVRDMGSRAGGGFKACAAAGRCTGGARASLGAGRAKSILSVRGCIATALTFAFVNYQRTIITYPYLLYGCGGTIASGSAERRRDKLPSRSVLYHI